MYLIILKSLLVLSIILIGISIYSSFLPSTTCTLMCKSITWTGFIVMTWFILYYAFSSFPSNTINPCCSSEISNVICNDCHINSSSSEAVDFLCFPCVIIKAIFIWPWWIYECLKKICHTDIITTVELDARLNARLDRPDLSVSTRIAPIVYLTNEGNNDRCLEDPIGV